MMIKIILALVLIAVAMHFTELLVDWLEYELHVDTYVQSSCSNFREYRQFKKNTILKYKKGK